MYIFKNLRMHLTRAYYTYIILNTYKTLVLVFASVTASLSVFALLPRREQTVLLGAGA